MFGRKLLIGLCLLVVLEVLAYYYSLVVNKFDPTVDKNTRIIQRKGGYGLNNYEDIIRARAEQYQRRCRELNMTQDKRRIKNQGRMIVNDEYKLLYCSVPKISCSNLKRIFLILTGKTNKTDPLNLTALEIHGTFSHYLTSLNRYSNEQVVSRLRNYKKIIFVREPFERLLSGYRSKLKNGNKAYERGLGRKIIRTFRANASKESLDNGNDVTFGEFVQFIIQSYTNKKRFDSHWAPYTTLCPSCQIQYDFTGRFETLNDDVDFLLESIGKSDSLRFPRRSDKYNTTKTTDVLYQYYRDIDPNDIVKLRKIYENDSKLFDYKVPEKIWQILEEGRL